MLTPFRSPLESFGNNWQVYEPNQGNNWLVGDPFGESFLGSKQLGFPRRNPAQAFAPLLTSDLIETADKFQVLADLPGVDPADLDISIDGNFLVMKAHRRNVHETNTDTVHNMERSYGKVERRISMPPNADLTNVDTQFKNGVLTISFPKTAPTIKARKLSINSA
jgi:HSP20 family protein